MLHYVYENLQADRLLESLGLQRDDFHRFRDAFIDNDNPKQIVVKTQGGGAERECLCNYLGEDAERPVSLDGRFHDKRCAKVYAQKIKEHPQFVSEGDDQFNERFSWIIFNVPK